MRAIIAARPHSLYQGRTLPLDSKYSNLVRRGTRWTCPRHAMRSHHGVYSPIGLTYVSKGYSGQANPSQWPSSSCKENSGTRSFADLLLWLDPPSGVLGRIGRLVGDQERNKSSYSHTRERRQLLNKCQLVMATGGTIAQDLTMQWSTLGGFMQDLFLLAGDR